MLRVKIRIVYYMLGRLLYADLCLYDFKCGSKNMIEHNLPLNF